MDQATDSHIEMSDRERQVVDYASRGLANKVIAYELGLATSTVATHLSNVAAKLGLDSRAALIKAFAPFASTYGTTAPQLPTGLTATERDVVALVFAGMTNAEIARTRGVSVRTVGNQVAAAIRKLGVGSRSGIVAHLCVSSAA